MLQRLHKRESPALGSARARSAHTNSARPIILTNGDWQVTRHFKMEEVEFHDDVSSVSSK